MYVVEIVGAVADAGDAPVTTDRNEIPDVTSRAARVPLVSRRMPWRMFIVVFPGLR